MEVRTYRAANMQDALTQIRRDLGSDAVILQTREVTSGRLFRWLREQKEIEVTASAGIRVPSRLPPLHHAAPPPPSPESIRLKLPALEPTALAAPAVRPDVLERLAQLQARVEQLCRGDQAGRSEPPSSLDVPADELVAAWQQLYRRGFPPAIARELVESASRASAASHDAVADRANAESGLQSALATELALRLPPMIAPRFTRGQRRTILFAGPTGVGKTTTLAKVAARLKLEQQANVGLITVDTYRLAACDQLTAYANIMSVPIRVAHSPEELRAAMERLRHCDVILIDTAGRSPYDQARMAELRRWIEVAEAGDVWLVQSATTGPVAARQHLEAFSDCLATGLVLCKLDEAADWGHWYSLLVENRVPLLYTTHGQSVPDDLAAADRRRVAEALIGCPSSFMSLEHIRRHGPAGSGAG